MTKSRKLSVDLREGEVLSIQGGQILLKVEKKSGRQSRLVFEFKEHTEVARLTQLGHTEKLGAGLGPS